MIRPDGTERQDVTLPYVTLLSGLTLPYQTELSGNTAHDLAA